MFQEVDVCCVYILLLHTQALKISWFSGNYFVESVCLFQEVIFIMLLLISGLLVNCAIVETIHDLDT